MNFFILRIIHTYLLETSIKHKKKRIPLLNLLIDCILARSAPPNTVDKR